MKIGILTYYRVANFGANLQAVSTYYYLRKHGHTPVFLNYVSEEFERSLNEGCKNNIQFKTHIDFVDDTIKEQIPSLHNIDDVANAIKAYSIEVVIIGSDAVIQHHSLLERIKRGRRKPFYIEKMTPDRMFPNPYWGVGFDKEIPTALMSVSCQNSVYKYFSDKLKKEMYKTLSRIKYISVRDKWTEAMLKAIGIKKDIHLTPDPVFAFNQNAGELIPSKDNICERFHLPSHYVLISLHSQCLSKSTLSQLKSLLAKKNLESVALPMPTGLKFDNDFDIKIQTPLSPIDWYGLIKYADGYVGSNMHPIVVALHNAVPCFSIDIWGNRNFWGKTTDTTSSKVYDILNLFGINNNIRPVINGTCNVSAKEIIAGLDRFPKEDIKKKADNQYDKYKEMMEGIINSISSRSL